jgi:hypothetical protein
MAVALGVVLGGEAYAVAVAGPLARMEPVEKQHAKTLKAAIAQMVAQTG